MKLDQVITVPRVPDRTHRPPAGDLTVECAPILLEPRPTLPYRLLTFAFGWMVALSTNGS